MGWTGLENRSDFEVGIVEVRRVGIERGRVVLGGGFIVYISGIGS